MLNGAEITVNVEAAIPTPCRESLDNYVNSTCVNYIPTATDNDGVHTGVITRTGPYNVQSTSHIDFLVIYSWGNLNRIPASTHVSGFLYSPM